MHLGNGAITPECAAITMALPPSAWSRWPALRRQSASRQKLALAVRPGVAGVRSSSGNAPVLPGLRRSPGWRRALGLGAWSGLGAWTMAVILAVQALVLGDGGLSALGANILNMALLPAGCVAAGRQLNLAAGRWPHVACAAVAGISVPLAALLIIGQTALFRSEAELVGWQEFAAGMLATHLWIGLAEGGLTLAAAAAIAWLGQTSWKPSCRCASGRPGPRRRGFPLVFAPARWLRSRCSGGRPLVLAGRRLGRLWNLPASLGEQGSLLAATLLAGLLIATLAALVAARQPEVA